MSWNSRRRRGNTSPPEPRGVFTRTEMETAVSTIDKTCLDEVAMFVTQRFNREQVLPWLFPDTTLAKLRMVKGMVSTASNKIYTLSPGIELHMNYGDEEHPASTPAIENSALVMHSQRIMPLWEALIDTQTIHQKYGRVKHLLRWFNNNATEGAVRNYWPAAMALCPASSVALMTTAPVRYSTPDGLADILPLIRETAGTVAAMELIPKDIEAKPYNNLRVVLTDRKVPWEGIDISLDKQIFNL